MKAIVLKSENSKSLSAQVDSEDYPVVSRHEWHAQRVRDKVYAHSYFGSNHYVYMHHLIMGRPPKGYVVDHIDNDGLNNQKENLRFLPNAENIRRRYEDNPDTGIKLRHDKLTNPWQASVSLGGKTRHVGYFPTMEAAILARNAAIERYLTESR